MTDDFDDDALRSAFDDRSSGPIDAGSARAEVISRARRTRAMRTVAIGGATTAVVVAGLLSLPGADDADPAPADQPGMTTTDSTAPRQPTTSPPDASTPARGVPSTTVVRPVTTSGVDDGRQPAVPATTASPLTTTPSTTIPAAATTAPPTPSTPTPATSAPPTTEPPPNAPSTAPTSSVPISTPTTASTQADAPFTRTYGSTGGSIRVDWSGSALSLQSVAPRPGFDAEIEDESATRIRVRFRGDDDSRIEVRARDGKVEHTIS